MCFSQLLFLHGATLPPFHPLVEPDRSPDAISFRIWPEITRALKAVTKLADETLHGRVFSMVLGVVLVLELLQRLGQRVGHPPSVVDEGPLRGFASVEAVCTKVSLEAD